MIGRNDHIGNTPRQYTSRPNGEFFKEAMLFIDFAKKNLSAKAVNQFEKALNRNSDDFHQRVMLPNFFDPSRDWAMSIDISTKVLGRTHERAAIVYDEPALWPTMTYFTNPLRKASPPIWDSAGKPRHEPPSQRVVLGNNQIFTFEFDQPDIAFFETQMGWMRSSSSGKPIDSAMGSIYKRCSSWLDFVGITVNYSGNKSFHIHIVFDPSLVRGLLGPDCVRYGLQRHWDRLKTIVMDCLQPSCEPDAALRQPEQFRRLPGGNRLLEKPSILGIPAGTEVKQVTLWEMYRRRAARDVAASFFDPTLFAVPVPTYHSTPARPRTYRTPPSTAELTFLEMKMQTHFPAGGYPAFTGFTPVGDALQARFQNHSADRNPASFMNESHKTICLMGGNPLGLTPTSRSLHQPLGVMLDVWRDEFVAHKTKSQNTAEQEFAKLATCRETARDAIRNVLLKSIKENDLSFISAPEGISKTTGLFESHGTIEHELARDHIGNVMYAFLDYESAEEKCSDFNARHAEGDFVGIILRSFDRLYREVCTRLGKTPISREAALQLGHKTVWAAVQSNQPDVVTELQQIHTTLAMAPNA